MLFAIASPTFSEAPPPVLEALVGSHLSLACVAHGNPTPTITWLKDEEVIEGTSTRVGFYSSTTSTCTVHPDSIFTSHPKILSYCKFKANQSRSLHSGCMFILVCFVVLPDKLQ